MKNLAIAVLFILLGSCATPSSTDVMAPYLMECVPTSNQGEIEAHDASDPPNKTIFRVAEYVNCAGGRSIIVVSWTGDLTSIDVDLAEQVFDNFIDHFHPGESIQPVNSSGRTSDGTHFIIYDVMGINGTSI